MARQRGTTRNHRSDTARPRRRRAVGLSTTAGAFLAFGLGPLAGAPTAKADIFDDILDMAVGSAASSAITAVNPTDFLDPGVLSGLLGDLSTPAGWDTLLTDFSNPSAKNAPAPPPSPIARRRALAFADRFFFAECFPDIAPTAPSLDTG